MRLIENNWFVPGMDYDHDGLGWYLEQSLQTCDWEGDFVPDGRSCAQVFNVCSTGTAAQCRAMGRDTDADGLPDDVEVYGYDPLDGSDDQRMALWGADPTHTDVFVEVDAYDQSTATAGCQGFSAPSSVPSPITSGPTPVNLIGTLRDLPDANADFFDRMSGVFSGYPAGYNVDGQAGIRLHFDVGVGNPEPENTLWGDWGGGNSCVPSHVTCGYRDAYNNILSGGCPSTPRMLDARKWLFRYLIDAPGDGGAQSAGAAMGANVISTQVHELAHTLGLQHGGPDQSYGGAREAYANLRPMYPSRINYRYQDAAGRASIPDPSLWDSIGLSDGSWSGQAFSLRSMPEAPFSGSLDVSVLAHSDASWLYPEVVRSDGSVDWDQDGHVESSSASRSVIRSATRREARSHTILVGQGISGRTDLVTHGENLLLAYCAEEGASGDDELRLRLLVDADGDCRAFPERTADGGYKPCITFGERQSFSPLAAGVAMAVTSNTGLSDPVFLGYVEFPSSDLYAADMLFDPSGTVGEASYMMTAPSLVESGVVEFEMLGDGPVARLFYTKDGFLYERTRVYGAASWSERSAVQILPGSGSGAWAYAPSFFSHDGGLFAVGYVGGESHIWEYDRAAHTLTSIRDISHLFGGARVDAFSAAVVPRIGGAGESVVISYRIDPDGVGSAPPILDLLVVDAPGGTGVLEEFGAAFALSNGRQRAAMIYDQRESIGSQFSGLRVVREVETEGVSGYGFPIADLVMAPFARAQDPAYYCDYDDWARVRVASCSKLPQKPEGIDGDFLLFPYSEARCDQPLVAAEPDSSGGCSVPSVPLASSTSDSEVICEEY